MVVPVAMMTGTPGKSDTVPVTPPALAPAALNATGVVVVRVDSVGLVHAVVVHTKGRSNIHSADAWVGAGLGVGMLMLKFHFALVSTRLSVHWLGA